MKRYLVAFLLCAIPVLAGCPTAPTNGAEASATTPLLDHAKAERAAFQAKQHYGLALRVAQAYVKLPLCDKSPPPCATGSIVLQIQKNIPLARSALDLAEETARNPAFGLDIVNTSLAAGQAALKAFTTITDKLPPPK